ncbi:MAG: MBOAT family protein [Oscillatoria sp. SIO1A7]|nr:MBOAT family protein [Oscillatoria sp. SIO1A7]
MTFISILYGLFLSGLLLAYWSAQKQRSRLILLLIASLIFYASLQIKYIPLLLLGTSINFYLGLGISKNRQPRQSDLEDPNSSSSLTNPQETWNSRYLALFCLGIIFNIFLLLGFKYVPFFLTVAGNILDSPAALELARWYGDNIKPPLGISFFSFECISYLVDVYRGAPPSQNFLKFAVYKFFFPKLLSGPIARYHNFIRQLKTLHFPASHQLVEGLWLIACGAIKKGIVADRLAQFVNLCFDNLERAGSGDLRLATFAYGLQLYLDFSGYVDIALGSALLLGFKLPQNFDFPYFTTSIAEFWRRWHISLGDWLRNYLYFPLGGSRKGLAITCLNLAIVMLVAGIWHGAAWGFIVWGALHGIALVVHRLVDTISGRFSQIDRWWQSYLGTIVAWLLTQNMVFLSWIVFRLPDLKQSGWVIQHLWGRSPDVQFTQKIYIETLGLMPFELCLLLIIIAALMGCSYLFHKVFKLQLNWPIKILLVPLCFFAVLLFAPENSTPYIYFDF